jgi:hypothetical protein
MMGMNISQLLGSDPDVLRAQLMQQEMARYNQYQDPRMNLASTLGGLLGGGVVNVAQGRNFFESNNPVLRKASQLQEIYNTTAQAIDPTANPGDFYRALQGNLAAAGFGPQAAMAAQEAYKFAKDEREMSLKERQVTAQEKNVAPFAQGNYVSEKGPLVFNRETGGYTVNGEPYTEAKHGKVEFAAKPDWRKDLLGGGQPGASGTPAAPGKGKGKEELSDEEKRARFNRVQGNPTGTDGNQYLGESFGPNTPDAVLDVGVKANDKQAIKESERRKKVRASKQESDAAIASGIGL